MVRVELSGPASYYPPTFSRWWAFWVRPVNLDVLQADNVVVAALAESLGKPLPWAVGFFFGNLELSMELWSIISGISGFYD
jgi:hypothetical protein